MKQIFKLYDYVIFCGEKHIIESVLPTIDNIFYGLFYCERNTHVYGIEQKDLLLSTPTPDIDILRRKQ